ncbi:hypothetical protein GCM10011491_36290 [Brucella endophytica]|uniref:SnoaL-like domain-containing protein n=1 Tax=Brucella endophytica TaxID=1963359 RepID=A0A916SLF7_9HYPH|nr:nuclear transport factor 2 family protein [Brucella endophytica]GGB04901.1 hypothetical protein GCM10011491_36290 [Brucella endophytica]
MSTFRINRNLSHVAGLLLVTLVFAAPAAAVHAERADVSARNEAIVRQAFDKWQAGGNVFAELLAPDIKWTIHGSGPVARTYTGLEDFTKNASGPLVSRLATPITPRVHNIWTSGDAVIVRFDGTATTTSGEPYNNQFVWIFRMADGRVTEAEAFLDLAAYQAVVENNAPRVD